MELHNQNLISASLLIQQCQSMRSVKHSSTLSLLDAAKENFAIRHENLKVTALRLIESSKPRIARIEKDRYDNASSFNVFSALNVARKEVIQSRFLAYLLSPQQDHNQGTTFLKAFLDKLDIQMDNITQARVVAERSAGAELGRMDIVIDCKPSLIVIENKIDACEGVEQLPRYRKWLDRQRGYGEDKKHLIFLTPTGHESVTGAVGAYQQFSYSDLADAFAELLEDQSIIQPSVREVLCQYVLICESLGGENMATQDKELQELLTRPENFRAALEMEQQTALARTQIAMTFTSNVIKVIRGKIEMAPEIRNNWRAIDTSDSNGNTYIRIQTARHNIKPNFSFYAEYLFACVQKGGKFGWVRPCWVDIKLLPQETASLSEKMIESGCISGAEGWFLASAGMCDGAGSFILSNNDDIIVCHEDNLNPIHPNATHIADEIWAMFIAYREDIEALPSYQQAASS